MINLEHEIQKTEAHQLDDMSFEELCEKASNVWWRLSNLYYLVSDEGKRFLFTPNPVQQDLLENLWYMNLILKSRQHGVTSVKCLLFLDKCLFTDSERPHDASIIAHTADAAFRIFQSKVLYPYLNLPESLLKYFKDKQKQQTQTTVRFGHNDSFYSVSTSVRAGTPSLLHISEFGLICSTDPKKAQEIVTGGIPAVHTQHGNSIVTIESTAEGAQGFFYDYSNKAEQKNYLVMQNKHVLSSQEFKFHFFPWWRRVTARSSEAVNIPARLNDYFNEIELKLGITLDIQQRYWYAAQEDSLGFLMKKENPSTAQEAFAQNTAGLYFKDQVLHCYETGRIGEFPVLSIAGVRTWWDLGLNGMTCIWFTQDIEGWVNVVDYYENSGKSWDHYADVLVNKKYIYIEHVAPHDIAQRQMGAVKVEHRWELAAQVGLQFRRVPRIAHKIDAINIAKAFFPMCRFDKSRCEVGLSRLETYRQKYNSMTGSYSNEPVGDDASHGADAFQTLACGHNPIYSGEKRRGKPWNGIIQSSDWRAYI